MLSKFLRRPLFVILFLLSVSGAWSQTTLFVTSAADAGAGTLREAVGLANAASSAADPHEIRFNLAIGTRIDLLNTIVVAGTNITINGDIDGDRLPDITLRANEVGISGIEVNGSDNSILYLNISEFDGSPRSAIYLVDATGTKVLGNFIGTDISGTVAAAVANFRGITIEGGSNNIIGDGTPEGRNIFANSSFGIYLTGTTTNSILGNYVGVGRDGKTPIPNLGRGVEIINSTDLRIGGLGPGEGNVVSGNGQDGILLNGASNTSILGNYIGTDSGGTESVPNSQAGITIGNATLATVIQGNLISGNGAWGIEMTSSSGDLITSNLIGTDITGLLDLGNNNTGIWVGTNCSGVKVGDGTSAGRNIISGNSGHGVLVGGGNNLVQGNYIGTDISGIAAIGNGISGVTLSGNPGNTVGGSGEARNIISGNSYGIGITTSGHFVYGNYIGTDAGGTSAVPNVNGGIRISVNAVNNRIGDGTDANANVISGNNTNGILLGGANVNSNVIDRNFIGTTPNGLDPLGNTGNGILIDSDANNNLVQNSVIAYNGTNGIEVNGSFAPGTLQNVFTQNSYFSNTAKAISVINGAHADILAPVIIDNDISGVVIGTSDPDAQIEVYVDSEDEGRAYMGSALADPSGAWTFTIDPVVLPAGLINVTAIQNSGQNTSEFSNAQQLRLIFTVINTLDDDSGGTLRWTIINANTAAGKDNIIFNIPNLDPGYTNNAGEEFWTINVLSPLPEVTEAIVIDGTNQPGTGAYKIRLDGGGLVTIGLDMGTGNNEIYGLYITRFTNVGLDLFYLGGPTIVGAANKGNVINGCGTGITVALADNNIFHGNIIGLDETGTVAIPNTGAGISFASNSGGNIVGGPNPGERNIISGNGGRGINVNAGSGQRIEGNFIGTDITGLLAIGNTNGTYIGTSGGNTIVNNVISGNSNSAMVFIGSSNNVIQGNFVGVGSDGVTPVPNTRGISMIGNTGTNFDNNLIGGTGAGEGNIFAHNIQQGILLNNLGYDFNQIIGNSMYCNGALNIDLNLEGNAGNDGKLAPEITSVTTSDVSGTGVEGEVIHVYRDDTGCLPVGGSEYLGTTTVVGGVWSLTGLSLTGTEIMNATATDATNSTSQFAVDFPEIDVFLGPDASGTEILNGQLTDVDVGSEFVGTDRDTVITIVNNTWVPLTVSSVTVLGADFTVISAPGTVDPRSSASITLRLSGAVIGVFNARLTIVTNDPDEATFDFPLVGSIEALPAPNISVFDVGTALQILNGQPTPVDMGIEYLGTDLPYSISIQNGGNADLVVSDITADDPAFTIQSSITSIPPAGQATFDVVLSGASTGTYTGTVTITSDDADEGTFVFRVTGTIDPFADILIWPGPDKASTQPFVNGSGTILGGPFVVGVGRTTTVSIENVGDLPLNISAITSTDPAFSIPVVPATVAPGTYTNTDILFDPPSAGTYQTTISVQSDDPFEPTYSISMDFEAVLPADIRIFLGPDTSGPEVLLDGTIDLGSTSLDVDLVQEFTIQNNGGVDLTVSSVDISNNLFSNTFTSSVIPPGSTTQFTVTMGASATGIFSSPVLVSSDDPVKSSFAFTIQGEVSAPALIIRENSQTGVVIDESIPIDMGTTPLDTDLEKVFVLENTGTQVLTVQSISVDNSAFQVINVPATIDPGTFAEFSVVFTNAELGSQQATVTIVTDAGTFTFFVVANVVDLTVYNALSPNGDGIHDFLNIENAEFFPNNTVHIYTRWGNEVFRMEGYNNNDRIFDGTGNQGSVGSLPDGTYYYIVVYEYTNSNNQIVSKKLTGFFLIRRDQ